MTPIIDRSSMNSSVQSNRSITTPEIEKKNDEIAKRLEQLRADAAFVVRIYSTSIIFMLSVLADYPGNQVCIATRRLYE